MSTISTEEFNEISRELERHHGLFYQFWSLGRPVFVDDIPTAAVQFDCAGDCVLFMFNPEYWNKLCNYERCFVIAHECLHVSLNHGVRTMGIVDGPVNECLDVVVNELLVDKFGFDRSKLSDGEDYCWVDTVFPKEKDMPKDKSFEYYYSKANNPNVKINSSLVDVHSYLSAEEWDQIVDICGDAGGNKLFVSTSFLGADKKLILFDKFELLSDRYGKAGVTVNDYSDYPGTGGANLLPPALVNYVPRYIGPGLASTDRFFGIPDFGYRDEDSWQYVERFTLNLYIAPVMLAIAHERTEPCLAFRRFCRIERRLKVEIEELQGIRKTEFQIDYTQPKLPPMADK